MEILVSFKLHFRLMAGYNSRMNEQVYQAASNLSHSDLNKDVGAFFGSTLGTLNHILVGDLLWLSRFCEHTDHYKSLGKIKGYPSPRSLEEQLYSNLVDLSRTRKEIDDIISGLCHIE